MNILKRFVRSDNGDDAFNGFDDEPYAPEDLNPVIPDTDTEAAISAIDDPERKNPEIRPAAADKVSLKLLQPKSHIEATKIADKLKEGCIVLLDMSNLTKESAIRLVDFLAGVAYVLGGEMIKTNKTTIVVSPAGVDISGFAPEAEEPAPEEPEESEESEDAEEYVEETYEEDSLESGN